jgi:hypothetical protein
MLLWAAGKEYNALQGFICGGGLIGGHASILVATLNTGLAINNTHFVVT